MKKNKPLDITYEIQSLSLKPDDIVILRVKELLLVEDLKYLLKAFKLRMQEMGYENQVLVIEGDVEISKLYKKESTWKSKKLES